MGTFVDQEFICEGDKVSVEKARKCIERFQKKTAEYSGNGSCDFSAAPTVSPDGLSLSYGFYCQSTANDLKKSLVGLTKSGGLKLIYYFGSTDGVNFGFLCEAEHGRLNSHHEFNADVGMKAARAAATMTEAKSEAAFAALVQAFDEAARDEFLVEEIDEDLADENFEDDEDNASLVKLAVIAGFIGVALSEHPELLDLAGARKVLSKLRPFVQYVKAWMTAFELGDDFTNQVIDGLIASLEALEIDKSVKAANPKPACQGASREAVRI